MKHLQFLLLAVLTSLFSCENDSHPEQKTTVSVHLQASFDNDNVSVWIDNREIADERVTTMHVLGFAKSFDTSASKGMHRIKVVVNDSQVSSSSFYLADDLYIGVQYDRQTKDITYIYSDEPFGYD